MRGARAGRSRAAITFPERLKRYHQGKKTEMACKYAKRTDHGWECTNAKASA